MFRFAWKRFLIPIIALLIGIPLAGFLFYQAMSTIKPVGPVNLKTAIPVQIPVVHKSNPEPNKTSTIQDLFAGLEQKTFNFIKIILYLAIPIVALIISTRLRYRKKRLLNMAGAEIILSRDDTAEPFEVMSFLDSCYAALVTRNLGLFRGHDHMVWEVISEPGGAIRFYLSAPAWVLESVKSRLQSTYQNIRFGEVKKILSNNEVRQQFNLARRWIYPLRSLRNYQSSITEALVSVLSNSQGQSRLQFLMVPKGLGFQRKIKLFQKAYEKFNLYKQVTDQSGTDPGMGYVEDKELKSALEITGKGIFATEIRLCCDSLDTARAVAGVLGEASGENRLVPPGPINYLLLNVFKKYWLKWINDLIPSIFLFRKCILSSFHLATIIHLPSVRVRVAGLNRCTIRRAPAPMKVSRDEKHMLMKDEKGPVGVLPQDRRFNMLLYGTQGGGKTTVIERLVYCDAQDYNKAQIIFDPNSDMAKKVLGIIPPSRKVIYIDASDPTCPWSINPFAHYLNKDLLVDNQMRSFQQKWGKVAIGPRSEDYLGHTMYALLDVKKHFTYMDVFMMLSDPDFREEIINKIKDPFEKTYWTKIFLPLEEKNPKALEEQLQAPRNKISRLVRGELRNIIIGPNAIDLERELREEKAIIIFNLPKGLIGEDNAFLIGIWVINQLWNIIQGQAALPLEERVKISIILEEVKNLICGDLELLLSEGRKWGAESTVAYQFNKQIEDEVVLSSFKNLIQNIVLFRTQQIEDAEQFSKLFMRIYSNNIQVSDEVQDRINFGPDDIINIPIYNAICRWMVDGEPQAPFIAETVPVKDYNPEWAEYHKSKQYEYAKDYSGREAS